MRSKLIPALVAVSLTLGGAAFAKVSDTTGMIKAIDMKALTVTLDDGKVFYFSSASSLDGFKIGEKVTIAWTLVKKDMASSIKAG